MRALWKAIIGFEDEDEDEEDEKEKETKIKIKVDEPYAEILGRIFKDINIALLLTSNYYYVVFGIISFFIPIKNSPNKR